MNIYPTQDSIENHKKIKSTTSAKNLLMNQQQGLDLDESSIHENDYNMYVVLVHSYRQHDTILERNKESNTSK